MNDPRLCLVGAGNMGGAMLAGWLASGRDPASIEVIDPGPPDNMRKLMVEHGVCLLPDADSAARPDFLIVAVKPQIMAGVLPGLVSLMDADNVLMSVAAGTTLTQLQTPFGAPGGQTIRAIRVMPNTPAMVRRGMSVCVAGDRVSAGQRDTVTTLLSAIGEVDWIEDEALMDAVTGVSGSGPAYAFHLAEALADAGVTAGLPRELALKLAVGTVSGAGELMRQSDQPPSTLRENVTSPKGTTAAALEVLMGEGGFPELLTRAVAAATSRSQELSED